MSGTSQQLDATIISYERALRLNPNAAEVWHNYAVALRLTGRGTQAVEAAMRAIAINPNIGALYDNLGAALLLCGRRRDAVVALQRAIELEPRRADAHFHLANAHFLLGWIDNAIVLYQHAIALNPQHGDAISNLATMFHSIGQVTEALELDRRAIPLVADAARAHSRMLFTMNFVPDITPQQLFNEHREWGIRYAGTHQSRPASADSAPDRRLRIGYVSPDFAQHAVMTFFEPILAAHDREQFEITCYSNTLLSDTITERLRGFADRWRDITTQDDDTADAQIRADKIDILVDLAGHTDRNRLPLFARRPAPFQISYLGYPNTTGTTAIDLRITDAIADPPGDADSLHTERLARLPRTAWCYRATDEAPPVAPPPSHDDSVTFGSFNNLAKLNDRVLELWADVLRAAGNSRLLIKTMTNFPGTRLIDALSRCGISSDRIEILPPSPTLPLHFAAYGKVDIALDPFPYNGTTTTCDALWMGVPVIALRGDRHVSRVSASLLAAVELDDLVAPSKEDYVNIAVQLAQNPGKREELRHTLRDRMRRSSLMNAADLASAIERVYRESWQRLIVSEDSSSDPSGR